MSTLPEHGSIVWMHNPNPDNLPFMACVLYTGSILEVTDQGSPAWTKTVEVAMVHNDEYMATADDLIYWPKDHGHHETLVVQTRLTASGIPVTYNKSIVVGKTICKLNDEALKEIRQTIDGVRRATYRTGVLVRSESEFRWEFVIEQKQQLDDLLISINSPYSW
jgi:hypothetical protein